ncbi:hypothetical protein V7S43_009451 [Phytophthora oleae]|uniref:Short chain dehydrogenase n=1 Tax=Phytophthora oleae TaxID=2107226 RepID=A0ABD3FEQ7_9STRA
MLDGKSLARLVRTATPKKYEQLRTPSNLKLVLICDFSSLVKACCSLTVQDRHHGHRDEASMLEAARQLEGIPIDLLINNAGMGIYTTFETASKDAIMKTLQVNALGPFLATRALVSNLKLAAKDDQPAVVLQISSILGSVTSNNEDYAQLFRGQYGYTTSKAALNMITRSLAMDLRESNIAVVAVNPGYVATDMSNHQGVIKADDAVAAMDSIVSKLSLDDSGKFFNADPAIPASELSW